MMIKTMSFLVSRFEMKDMGTATYVLGIKITRDRNAKLLYMDQENYLEKILKKFNMAESKALSSPINKGIILSKNMHPKDKKRTRIYGKCPLCLSCG